MCAGDPGTQCSSRPIEGRQPGGTGINIFLLTRSIWERCFIEHGGGWWEFCGRETGLLG